MDKDGLMLFRVPAWYSDDDDGYYIIAVDKQDATIFDGTQLPGYPEMYEYEGEYWGLGNYSDVYCTDKALKAISEKGFNALDDFFETIVM